MTEGGAQRGLGLHRLLLKVSPITTHIPGDSVQISVRSDDRSVRVDPCKRDHFQTESRTVPEDGVRCGFREVWNSLSFKVLILTVCGVKRKGSFYGR